MAFDGIARTCSHVICSFSHEPKKICVSYSSNRLFTSSCLVDFWISVDSVFFFFSSFSFCVSWFWCLFLFKHTNKTKKLKRRERKKSQTRTANREPMTSFIAPNICLSHLLCWFLMQPFLIDHKVDSDYELVLTYQVSVAAARSLSISHSHIHREVMNVIIIEPICFVGIPTMHVRCVYAVRCMCGHKWANVSSKMLLKFQFYPMWHS